VFVIGEGGGIGLGLMFGMAGIGTGIGPIIARYFTSDRDRPLRITIILAYFITTVGLLIVAPLTSFGWVLFGTTLRAVGGGIAWVFSTQLLLQLVPNHIRGRIFATEFAMFSLLAAVGAAATGAIMDTSLGLTGVILLMAIVSLLPGLLWAVWVFVGKPTPQSVSEDGGLKS
jgi:MFS family permease